VSVVINRILYSRPSDVGGADSGLCMSLTKVTIPLDFLQTSVDMGVCASSHDLKLLHIVNFLFVSLSSRITEE
jgi:hypothetical protein